MTKRNDLILFLFQEKNYNGSLGVIAGWGTIDKDVNEMSQQLLEGIV